MSNRKVYILGAGSSSELRFGMRIRDAERPEKSREFNLAGPLSSGFFYYTEKFVESAKKFSHNVHDVPVDDGLLGYIRKYYRRNCGRDITRRELLHNEYVSSKVNIEGLYTSIEKDIEKEERHHETQITEDWNRSSCYIRSSLLEYVFHSLTQLSWVCFSDYHRKLAKYIVRTGAHIISFNWDTLFDEELTATRSWNYEDGYGIQFDKVRYENAAGSGVENTAPSFNLLLKPHGSINWYRPSEGADEELQLFIPLTRHLRGGRHCDPPYGGRDAAIVPPGRKQPEFPRVWRYVDEVLSQAEEIVAIGFSFNDNDKYIVDEFKGIRFRENLSIGLVDPNADRLKTTYQQVFHTQRVTKICANFSDYCKMLAREPGMEDYAEFSG